MSSPPEPARKLLDQLKGRENPFDSLARPQRLDDHFLDLHVPELLDRERALLLATIDRYRVETYQGAADLQPTRVVTVLGDRGSGKTHLLRSLQYRPDNRSQLLIRPTYLDLAVPFEEYLLSQLVSALVEEDEVYQGRPSEDVAAALTRRLLRQSLLGLGPADRLFVSGASRWQRLRLLWGNGHEQSRRLEQLADALAAHLASGDLDVLLQRQNLPPEQGLRLIAGHLRRYELGGDVLASIRRQLYEAMARAALGVDRQALNHFLGGGYVPAEAAPGQRFEMVACLLHALIEACSLVQLPIVFAFDNLERLSSSQGQFDAPLIRAFLNNLAQAVDNTKGLLFLLFAESGLFDQLVAPNMDSFARDRLSQGVPLYGEGPVSVVRLGPPDTEKVRLLVEARMRRHLGDALALKELPAGFPFDPAFLQKVAGTGGQNLRITLQRVRDEYSRVVYGQADPPAIVKPDPEPPEFGGLLESLWKQHSLAAERKLTEPLTSHSQALHAGLGQFLQQAQPLAEGEWTLQEVHSGVSVGDHPNYGLVTLLTWRRPTSLPGQASSSLRLGVGLLLASGPGLAPDLRAKFDLFREASHGAGHLLVLWYTQREGEDLAEQLPQATKKVWDTSRHHKRAEIQPLNRESLRALAAFPDWLAAVREVAEIPAQVLRQFVHQRAPALLRLLTGCAVLQPQEVSSHEN